MYLKQMSEVQEELKLCRIERVRLEESNEKLRLRKSLHDTHSTENEQMGMVSDTQSSELGCGRLEYTELRPWLTCVGLLLLIFRHSFKGKS